MSPPTKRERAALGLVEGVGNSVQEGRSALVERTKPSHMPPGLTSNDFLCPHEQQLRLLWVRPLTSYFSPQHIFPQCFFWTSPFLKSPLPSPFSPAPLPSFSLSPWPIPELTGEALAPSCLHRGPLILRQPNSLRSRDWAPVWLSRSTSRLCS